MSNTLDAIFYAEHTVKVNRVQPLGDRVLIRRIEEQTDKQVQVADAFRPKSNVGQVIACGYEVNTHLNPGDKVIFSFFAQEVEIDDEWLVLTSIHDVWAKL
jgi:co-chaperonin GroES (HSP10)